jgi:hypothetical protein
MNVFTELIQWINDKNVPYWEQYALDLIVAGKTIGDSEIWEMVGFLLEDGGVIKKEARRHKLTALSRAAATTGGPLSKKVLIRGISGMENINALVPNQRLEFGNQLTVFYGANASGKSGYARLLANACFSRGDRDVLHDINQPDAAALAKQAVFHVERNGKTVDVPFVVDEGCPDLQSFYVHDTVSITAHLTERNEFSFTPFGLNFLGQLAEVSDQVGNGLESQIGQWSTEKDFAVRFEGNSPVRTQMEDLGVATDIEVLKKMAEMSEVDKIQKKDLETKIARLRAQSIPEEIKKRTKQMDDLDALLGKLMTIINEMGPQVSRSIETALTNLKKYKDQAKQLGIDQFKTTLFNQVGSEQWQRFIESAHELSIAEREDPSYPQGGDHCLLCRQKLGLAAVELLEKYWKFLQDDSRQKIRAVQSTLAATKESLRETDTDCFAETTVAYRLIEKENPDLLDELNRYVKSAKARKKQLIGMIDSGKPVELTDLPGVPVPRVRKIIQAFLAKIGELKKTDPTKQIAAFDGQLRLIKHRETLRQIIDPIAAYITDLKSAAKARRLKPNTAHISLMQGRLFDTLVTGEYIERFSQNLVRLGRPLPVEIRTRNNKGTSMKEICVRSGEYEPVKILSDGEKRIASLADFLTEVSLDPNAAGIILDDPVTSLDIEWKEEVAKRLVEESQVRQTIIFTHDLHFVYLLKQFAENLKVEVKCHWMVRQDPNGQPGHVYLNNSPALEKDYRSSAIAENYWKRAKTATPQDQENIIKSGFSALRTSYEALVMYELFAGVVERFQERTRIDLLDKVILNKNFFDRSKEKHALLSRYMEGHLHSDRFAARKPTPEMLKQEIDEFNTLKSQIKSAKRA